MQTPDTVITPYIWSQIAPTTAIICASITPYRPLFRNLSFRPLSHISWFTSSSSDENHLRSSSNINSRPPSFSGDEELAWPAPPRAARDRRSVVERFQGFIFNVPSDPSSRARTRPGSTANNLVDNEGPVLGIYEEMMKQRNAAAAAASRERDSGHGSRKASSVGSWLESRSSDDGVDRG